MGASRGFPGIPGSPVTKFSRLLLRNSSQGSFSFSGPGFRIYIADAWLKETQRALHGPASGFVTGHRRFVHVFINGYYWGVYDLKEHLDADAVSAPLLAGITNPTAAQKEQFKPSNILFGKPLAPPEFILHMQAWLSSAFPRVILGKNGFFKPMIPQERRFPIVSCPLLFPCMAEFQARFQQWVIVFLESASMGVFLKFWLWISALTTSSSATERSLSLEALLWCFGRDCTWSRGEEEPTHRHEIRFFAALFVCWRAAFRHGHLHQPALPEPGGQSFLRFHPIGNNLVEGL